MIKGTKYQILTAILKLKIWKIKITFFKIDAQCILPYFCQNFEYEF